MVVVITNRSGWLLELLTELINLTYLRLMGRIEHGHVLHVLVHVPWVRFDEVKAVVHDDPTDRVILCLGAVVLVSLPPVVV